MRTLALTAIALSLSACVQLPAVYVVDRHTVMEAEASGEWPQLEQRFRDDVPAMGPTDLEKDPQGRRRERAFRVLNGEFPTEARNQQDSAQ